ncbi:hypothetical protein M3Y94_00446300 [Aphelenchoides besseyi]|nr:hypothetical protein M3Y94_00446300 [Aphelenchoides besseyi]
MSDSGDAKTATKETTGNGKPQEIDTLPIDTDQTEVQDAFKGFDDGDEFEEFPIYDEKVIQTPEEPTDVNAWEDNWEDETVEKDFSLQLREELPNTNKRKAQS